MGLLSIVGGSGPGTPGAPLLLQLSMTVQADIALVHVVGEVDIASAPSLATVVDAACLASRFVIVDLSGVEYLDGAGICVLERYSLANPGRLVVVAPKPSVYRLFEVLGLLSAVPVVTSVDAAQTYLRPGRQPGTHALPRRWPFTSRVARFLHTRRLFRGKRGGGAEKSRYLGVVLLALGLTAGTVACLRYSGRTATSRLTPSSGSAVSSGKALGHVE